MEHLKAAEQLNKLISATAESEPRSFSRYFYLFLQNSGQNYKEDNENNLKQIFIFLLFFLFILKYHVMYLSL